MKLLWTFVMFLLCSVIQAQPSEKTMSRQQYIEKYHDAAIKEMLSSGIPASITMAQALLESDNGNSPLAKYANNHFGIKCHGWEGGKFIQDDDAKNECFRKYRKVEQSYQDHSEFLSKRGRYASLFGLKLTDYKSWAKGLRKAGYATNPKYADMLIKIIEDNDLDQYDKMQKAKKSPTKNTVEVIPVAKSSVLQPKKHVLKISNNNIKYVIAGKDDSAIKIAKENGMGLWQIYKYNDLEKGDLLKSGDIIYLQPKKNGSKTSSHVVKEGETIREISQFYGVKIKSIYKRNNLPVGVPVQVGQRLVLSGR